MRGSAGNGQSRQRKIHALLAGGVRVSVEAAARRLGVTTMTIRRDLDAMEKAGLVMRVHGGCVRRPAGFAHEQPFAEKAGLREAEKRAIARAAAAFFQPGESVYLDTGTTAAQVAACLPAGMNLRVFTNNLQAAMILFGRTDITLHVFGGDLASTSPDLTGETAIANVANFRTDWAVTGADAVSPATGEVFAADTRTAALSRLAQKQAARTMVVADSSKLGRCSLAVSGRLGKRAILITDDAVDAQTRRALVATGAKLIFVTPTHKERES